MDKQEIKQKQENLISMTRTFCMEHLDEDYAQLCESLIKKMGRKREVPFVRGKPEIWAAAVVYAIGSINFLFDKSFKPYMTAEQLCESFGTKTSTVSAKASVIRNMFNLGYFDGEFSTQRMADQNPFNDFVMIDGLVCPVSMLPDNLKQQLREARERGEDLEFFTRPPE